MNRNRNEHIFLFGGFRVETGTFYEFLIENLKNIQFYRKKFKKKKPKFYSTFFSVSMKARSCLCEKKVAYLALTLDTLALQIRIL